MDLRIDNNGVSLAVTRTGNPDGQPVLFLHGITNSRTSYLAAADRLGGRDCWALDFRGHGDSDRAPGTYNVDHYASDAAAVLATVGRPTVVVGHSLGGITAAHLAHQQAANVKALLLEDPPLFLAVDPVAFANSLYPKLFAMLRATVEELRAANAPDSAYRKLAANAPSPMGGVAGDHYTEAQLADRVRSYQLFDPAVLAPAVDGSLNGALDPNRPIACPVTVLVANEAYGAAFLPGDDARLRASTPHAEIIPFPEVGHAIRSSAVSEARYLDVLATFVAAHC